MFRILKKILWIFKYSISIDSPLMISKRFKDRKVFISFENKKHFVLTNLFFPGKIKINV